MERKMVVAVIHLEISVRRQTLAIITSLAGLILPIGLVMLKHAVNGGGIVVLPQGS